MEFSEGKNYSFHHCILYFLRKIENERISIEAWSEECNDSEFIIRKERIGAYAAYLSKTEPEIAEKINVWLSDTESKELFIPDISEDVLEFELNEIIFHFIGIRTEKDEDLGDEEFNIFEEE